MTSTLPVPNRDAPVEYRSSGGLRLRLWFACLGGALMAAGGIWWVIGTQSATEPTPELVLLVSWLGAVAGFGVLSAVAFALWIDHGIVAHARGLAQALALRQVARLRGLPATSGWGELSLLTQQIQQIIVQYKHAERATDDFGQVRDQLSVLHKALERWNQTERWEGLRLAPGPVAEAAESLDRGLRRLDDVRDQNLEAARLVTAELEQALGEARQSSEQAERGFLEATALLTTIRELQRLQAELVRVLGPGDVEPVGPEPTAEVVREAIGELVEGSGQTVERLARGLQHVQGIVDRVSLVANRATLVALDALAGRGTREGGDQAEVARHLVAEIRGAVEDTARLSRDLENEVAAGTAEMKRVREIVARKLEQLPTGTRRAQAGDEVVRLLDRVRDMVQNATTHGERLSAAGERSSRAAEAVLRRLEAETREMEGLLTRLASLESGSSFDLSGRAVSATPVPGELRMLGQEDLLTDAGEPWPESDVDVGDNSR